jgi:hypothetical protein
MIGCQNNVLLRSVLVFFFSFITFLILCIPIDSVADASGQEEKQGPGNSVTVLIYHRFGEERYPTTNVSVDGFREQLTYLRDNNYQVLKLAELYRYLTEKKNLPDKATVITIDDGYKSVYQYAWPLLQSFGGPGVTGRRC